MNNFNFNNFIKYIILFIVVTFSTFFIPSCNMISRHAVYIGLLASTTFVLLDNNFPNIVIKSEKEFD